ncbi:ester cyclase [Aestuariivirga litoralis]|uniref:ester cyclase n=1 Tax=Aestuariivirga litoralis TaxID=2650924 RepID=UPI0018C62648|nr:ester cyclase [Aestuariivirga litoralis]MBG1232769.1 ester cyclase [Aestuariivirga litoralis]
MTSIRQRKLDDFIRRVWSEGEVEACDDYLARRYAIAHDPGDPWDGQVLDVPQFQERVRKSRAPFPDQRFYIREWFESRDGLMISWDWLATHKGDLTGFPASGKRLSMSGATIYYFDADDRIFGHWQIADRLGVYQQLQKTEPARPKNGTYTRAGFLLRKKSTLASYGLI